MSADEFNRLFSNLAEALFPDQQRRIDGEIKKIRATDAAAGTLTAGALYIHLFQALRAELSTRAQEVRVDALRALSAISFEDASVVQELLRTSTSTRIAIHADCLRQIYEQRIPGRLHQSLPYDTAISEILATNSVEMELGLMRKKKEASTTTEYKNVFNAPIGVFQQADYAKAVVLHTVASSDISRIEAALNTLLEGIRESKEIHDDTRQVLNETLEEGTSLIRAEKPNKYKISSLIIAVKDAAETVPKVKDAAVIVMAGLKA
ncbi:hypothetical protein, partial [Herbaspirillum chlorophenolicum]